MANDSSADQTTSAKVEATEQNEKSLRPNPFTAHRDPETGQWAVIKLASG